MCDGSIRNPSTDPLGKSLGYQFTLFATNPSEEENRGATQTDSDVYLYDTCISVDTAYSDGRTTLFYAALKPSSICTVDKSAFINTEKYAEREIT
ncbi:hypothetical protein TNCV_3564221 [Trichonephila clavipes]|nr:hypothetical protein TNCV_3564221 [Trichonephila clavipes]